MNPKFESISTELEALAGRLPTLLLAIAGENLKAGSSIPVAMHVSVRKDYSDQISHRVEFSVGHYGNDLVSGTNLARVMEEYLRRNGWRDENAAMEQMLMLSAPMSDTTDTESSRSEDDDEIPF